MKSPPTRTPDNAPGAAVRAAGGARQLAQGTWKEFREFAFTGNVLDLAIGVILGAAFNTVVQAVVTDVLTPLIGIVGGNDDLVGATAQVAGAELAVGDLINKVLYFLITAAALFVTVKTAGRFRRQQASIQQDAVQQPTALCPECCEPVAPAARRCRWCTSAIQSWSAAGRLPPPGAAR
jgi:large conductance mechanosensitive channel